VGRAEKAIGFGAIYAAVRSHGSMDVGFAAVRTFSCSVTQNSANAFLPVPGSSRRPFPTYLKCGVYQHRRGS
jgi:hypothetical protein